MSEPTRTGKDGATHQEVKVFTIDDLDFGECDVCGQEMHLVPETCLCGVCCFGEAACADPENW